MRERVSVCVCVCVRMHVCVCLSVCVCINIFKGKTVRVEVRLFDAMSEKHAGQAKTGNIHMLCGDYCGYSSRI